MIVRELSQPEVSRLNVEESSSLKLCSPHSAGAARRKDVAGMQREVSFSSSSLVCVRHAAREIDYRSRHAAQCARGLFFAAAPHARLRFAARIISQQGAAGARQLRNFRFR